MPCAGVISPTRRCAESFRRLSHFAPQLIAKELGIWQNSNAWKRELPVQRPLRADAAAVTPTLNPQQIKAWCSARHLPFAEGRDVIYLPPESLAFQTPLAPALPAYPADAGLKDRQVRGRHGHARRRPDAGRAAQKRRSSPPLADTHFQLSSPARYRASPLRSCLRSATAAEWYGPLMPWQHVAPAPLLTHDCEDMVVRLRGLERGSPLKLVSEEGWSGLDFEPPDCNGNLLRDARSQRTFYVDAHKFILEGYEKHLRDLALSVTETSHVGGAQPSARRQGGFVPLSRRFPASTGRRSVRRGRACRRGTRCWHGRASRLKARSSSTSAAISVSWGRGIFAPRRALDAWMGSRRDGGSCAIKCCSRSAARAFRSPE